MGGCRGGPGSRITRKENSLSQFHDENKSFSRFTKKNARKQHYKMYKMLTFDKFPTLNGFFFKLKLLIDLK